MRNNHHRVGMGGDVVRRLRQIGRTRPCEDRLCLSSFFLRPIGEIPLPDLVVANGDNFVNNRRPQKYQTTYFPLGKDKSQIFA
eukprot:6817594-Pyramimonas_sp.AAC.1